MCKCRLDALRLRFEAPNENNRWDSPLFKVTLCKETTILPNDTKITSKMEDLCIANSDNVEDLKTDPTEQKSLSSVDTTISKSFTSSWRPKKKPVNTERNSNVSNDITDTQTVFTCASDLKSMNTGANNKSISFSGTMVIQEVQELAEGFMLPEEALSKISDYFQGAITPIVPNSSTIATQRANPDLLYELDRISQEILQSIVSHQQSDAVCVAGTPLKFSAYDRSITLHRHISLAELQRYRRQYVKINGQHASTTAKAIGASFIDFLALHI